MRDRRVQRAMTLAVPDCPEMQRLKVLRGSCRDQQRRLFRKMSLGGQPLINGYHGKQPTCVDDPPSSPQAPPQPPTTITRRTSLADAFSGSIRTLAMTARRSSSPLTRRLTTKKMKKSRLVLKNGLCNVYNTNVPKKDRQYLRDIFTTMIDVKWRYIFVTFSLVFLISWSTFALVYFSIAFMHDDFSTSINGTITDRQPCIVELSSLYSAFLYSVETQHTIGYGTRYLTTECPLAGAVLCLQCITGLLIQSFMVGLVFAKMARPKKRAETLIFSENAVICLRDGQLCFMFRVGDMRNTHLVEAHARLQLICDRETQEGEVGANLSNNYAHFIYIQIEPLHQFEMKVGPTENEDRIFLVWPIALSHTIDATSPLYDYTAATLPTAQFEIVVLLEGIVESTGMTAQARTSYLPSEILWGHRFKKLVTYQRSNGSYRIDYDLFHSTYEVNTPACSANEFSKQNPHQDKLEQYFCPVEGEHKLEDSRSWECSPTPSPFVSSPPSPSPMLAPTHHNSSLPAFHFFYDNNSMNGAGRHHQQQESPVAQPPPTIIVQSPSSSNSPKEQPKSATSPPSTLLLMTTSFDHANSCASSSSRPSTALSDLEEETSEIGSPDYKMFVVRRHDNSAC